MRLALLQVNDHEEIYLIDTVLIEKPGESASFLFSDSVIKIFHSCKEDLEAVYSWTKREMSNIFDTQIANSLLNDDYSISYQSLVERNLGILLDKKETRSNWIRRPLSDAQLKYAALDVEYLIHLYIEQNEKLKKSKKLNWHNQDIGRLLEVTFNPQSQPKEINRILTKAQENDLLNNFNQSIERIAHKTGVNSTLLFSKKAQRDFLRLALDQGIELACTEITRWREDLIKSDLQELLK